MRRLQRTPRMPTRHPRPVTSPDACSTIAPGERTRSRWEFHSTPGRPARPPRRPGPRRPPGRPGRARVRRAVRALASRPGLATRRHRRPGQGLSAGRPRSQRPAPAGLPVRDRRQHLPLRARSRPQRGPGCAGLERGHRRRTAPASAPSPPTSDNRPRPFPRNHCRRGPGAGSRILQRRPGRDGHGNRSDEYARSLVFDQFVWHNRNQFDSMRGKGGGGRGDNDRRGHADG